MPRSRSSGNLPLAPWVGFLATALALFANLALSGCSPAPARVPSEKETSLARIGYLAGRSSLPSSRQSFLDGLGELGHVAGQNLAVDFWIEGEDDRSSFSVADEMAGAVHVIVAEEPDLVRAAMAATTTVPIVMTGMRDVVELGLVQSRGRPGGNVTGMSSSSARLASKQLELLKEAVPGVTRVAVLTPRLDTREWAVLEDAATQLELELMRIEDVAGGGGSDLETAVVRAAERGANALLPLNAPTTDPGNRYLAQLAARYGLPAIYGRTGFAESGGLLAFAPSSADQTRRAAAFVDKLIRGAKAAELPVEEPTSFVLYVNLNAAEQLRLALAPSIIARATRLIGGPAGSLTPLVPQRGEGLAGAQPGTGQQPSVGWSPPDAFGYRYIDSRTLGGPEPVWFEGVTTGVVVHSREPGYRLAVPIGFDFPFYGFAYNRLAIHTDGVVTFRATEPFLGGNQRLPGTASVAIATFWDDLPVGAQGQISYRLYGRAPERAFVIQWSGGRYRDSRINQDSPAAQLILHEDGRIVLGYALPTAAVDRGSATIGIQNENRSIGLTYAHNQARVRDGLTILFARLDNARALPYVPADASVTTRLSRCQEEGTSFGFHRLLETEGMVQSQIGCPLSGEQSLVSVEQFFDGGHMLLTPDKGEIIVTFEDNRRWAAYRDTYAGGPEPDFAVAPPADRDRPEGAFGKLWRENPGLRDRLGWPVGPVRNFRGTLQEFQRGTMAFTGQGQWLRAYLEDGTTVQG